MTPQVGRPSQMVQAGEDLNKKPSVMVRSVRMNGCEQTTACATDDNKPHRIFPITLNKQCYSGTLLFFDSVRVMYHMIWYGYCSNAKEQVVHLRNHTWSNIHPDFRLVRLQTSLSPFPMPLTRVAPVPAPRLPAGRLRSLPLLAFPTLRSWQRCFSTAPWPLPLICLFTVIRSVTQSSQRTLWT